MKKIVLVVECDLSASSGMAINERESVRALLESYDRYLTVVAPAPEHPDVFYDHRIAYVARHHGHQPWRYLWFLYAAWKHIKAAIANGMADAVAFRLGLWPILPILVARMRIPVLLKTVSGYAVFERQGRRWQFQVLSGMLRPFFVRAVRGSTGIDTPSFALALWLRDRVRIAPEAPHVIPNGVNVQQFAPTESSGIVAELELDRFEFRLGYVGAMDSLRHIDTAIRAMPFLSAFPSLGMVLVGRGPNLEELRQLADDEGVSDRVRFIGFQPYARIPAIISSFDIAFDLTQVTMKIDGRTVTGCFSQKIPQYLACGVPVVAYRCQDTDFLMQLKVGETVADNDPAALAGVFAGMLRRRHSPEFVAETIRRVALEGLSYQSIAEQRFCYWQDVLGRAPTQSGHSDVS